MHKTYEKQKYDDHYHFYLNGGIVGFHKTIQCPTAKASITYNNGEICPGGQDNIAAHITCNFNNDTDIVDFEDFKSLICNSTNSTMSTTFTEEDLYYIYEIISKPFLENEKIDNRKIGGKKRYTRNRRFKNKNKTRKHKK